MACDICGNNDEPLEQLTTDYQTDDIKQVCPKCLDGVSRLHSRLQDMPLPIVCDALKRYMANKKKKLT